MFKRIAIISIPLTVLMAVGCSGGGGGGGGGSVLGTNDGSSAQPVSSNARYAGTISVSTPQNVPALANVTGTAVCSKSNYAATTTVSITFDQGSPTAQATTWSVTGAGNTSGSTTSFNVVPGDTTCAFTITGVTLGTSAYTFPSNPVVTSSTTGAWLTATKTNALAGAANPIIYVAAQFSSNWVPATSTTPATLPYLTFVFGENESTVNGSINASFGTIPLNGVTNTGSSIPAPSYCIASTASSACQTGANPANFTLTYDNNYYVMTEKLNLFPTADGITANASGQTGEFYKIVSLTSNNALVNAGTADVSISSSVGTVTGSCGVVDSITVTTGCSYTVVDALFNAGSGINIHASGNVSGASATTATVGSNAHAVSSGKYTALSWALDATQLLTGDNLDFLGFTPGSTVIPAVTAQSAVRYLIIKHQDGYINGVTCTSAAGSCVNSYQLFVFIAGHP